MANLFPTESVSGLAIDQEASTQVTFGRGWKFDFDVGEFVTSPTGRMAPATELEAFREWCQKALLTPRYRHVIYSRNYGHEFDELMGQGYPKPVVESEIERIVRDTLKVDPRTGDVSGFEFAWEGDKLFFSCNVTTVNSNRFAVSSEVVIGG